MWPVNNARKESENTRTTVGKSAPARAMGKPLLRKSRWPWPDRCVVCGAWGWLPAWDEGLQGRFCTGCFDHVVDAEEALAGQGLVCLARAATARRRGRASRDPWRHWLELGALWALWGGGVAWPWGERKEGPLGPVRRRAQGESP